MRHGTAEHRRLAEHRQQLANWKRWGPYVSDRSWGTVREDYSAEGTAWEFLPHDLARSKTYRWGEDGIAALCDRYQLLVFSPALWNGRDPILKERYFGLTPHHLGHGLGDPRGQLGLVDRLAVEPCAQESPDALGTGDAADVGGQDALVARLHAVLRPLAGMAPNPWRPPGHLSVVRPHI